MRQSLSSSINAVSHPISQLINIYAVADLNLLRNNTITSENKIYNNIIINSINGLRVNNTDAHGNILYSNKIINAIEQRIRTDETNAKYNNITKDDNV